MIFFSKYLEFCFFVKSTDFRIYDVIIGYITKVTLMLISFES